MNGEILHTQDEVLNMILNNEKDEVVKGMDNFFKEMDMVTLLEVNPNIFNQVDKHGNTLLHYAVSKNESFLISEALKKGYSVLIPNKYGLTAVDYSNLFEYENTKNVIEGFFERKQRREERELRESK